MPAAAQERRCPCLSCHLCFTSHGVCRTWALRVGRTGRPSWVLAGRVGADFLLLSA